MAVGKQVSARVGAIARYQLTYYVFKVRKKELGPRIRRNLHHVFAKYRCLQRIWPSLQLPWREAYTQADEEIATSYLLHRYSDLIDRRHGSVVQKEGAEPYMSGGVLLETHVVGLLREERDKLATSAEQEEDLRNDIRAIIREEIQHAPISKGFEMHDERRQTAHSNELFVEQPR